MYQTASQYLPSILTYSVGLRQKITTLCLQGATAKSPIKMWNSAP